MCGASFSHIISFKSHSKFEVGVFTYQLEETSCVGVEVRVMLLLRASFLEPMLIAITLHQMLTYSLGKQIPGSFSGSPTISMHSAVQTLQSLCTQGELKKAKTVHPIKQPHIDHRLCFLITLYGFYVPKF